MTFKTLERKDVTRFQRAGFTTWTIPLLFVFFVVVVLLPACPAFLKTPEIESGQLMYFGAQILDGAIPYRDLWDSHPPLVYFLNALGLWAGGAWGVWVLQVLALSIFSWCLFEFLRLYFGSFAAAVAVAGLLASLFLVNGYGNSPEVYILPLQAGGLLVFSKAVTQQRARILRFLLVGILIGLSSSLKLTMFGMGIAMILYLALDSLWKRTGSGLIDGVRIGIGAGLPWLIWLIYLSSHQAFQPFWEQTVRYPYFYTGVTYFDRFNAIQEVLKNLISQSSFILVGMLAWLAAFLYLLVNHIRFREAIAGRGAGIFMFLVGIALLANGGFDDRTGRIYAIQSLSTYRISLVVIGLLVIIFSLFFITGWTRKRLAFYFASGENSTDPAQFWLPVIIALVDFPIQVVLAGVEGQKNYNHFLPIIPSLGILVCFFVWHLNPTTRRQPDPVFASIWTWALVGLTIFTSLFVTVSKIQILENRQVTETVQYIQDNSHSQEKVLLWGMEERVLLLAKRDSATHYLDKLPLFTQGYATSERVDAFLNELKTETPALVFDMGIDRLPLVLPEQAQEDGSFDPSTCESLASQDFFNQQIREEYNARGAYWKEQPLPFIPDEMGQVYRYICQNYRFVGKSGPNEWPVYRFDPGQE